MRTLITETLAALGFFAFLASLAFFALFVF